jgi:hypothetical protein
LDPESIGPFAPLRVVGFMIARTEQALEIGTFRMHVLDSLRR